MTLSMPNDVYEEMQKFSEVKWSEVARKAIITKLETLKLADEIASKSKLTQQDVDEFSKKINSLATKRFLK
jgi:predicted CopG family antitoxin